MVIRFSDGWVDRDFIVRYRRGTVTYGLHVGLLFCIHALFAFKYHGGLISSHSDLHIFRW